MPDQPPAASAVTPGAPQTVTMLCLLSGSDGSGYSHDYISRTVLAWAAEKFPRMMSGVEQPTRSFSAKDGATRLDVRAGDDELFSWTLRCEHPGTGEPSSWLTEVCLANFDGVDHLGVRNSYFGTGSSALKPTQPRFLRPLVDHLTYHDGGIRVGVKPLFAQGPRAFENFCDHLQARHRELSLVVLTPQPRRTDEEPRFGANPWTLAQWLGGLAHVVAVGDNADEQLQRRFGVGWGIPAGGARVLQPDFRARTPERHPLFNASGGPGHELHDALCQQVYADSSRTSRANRFSDLWARCQPR